MRPVLMGLVMVASLAMSLIGAPGLGSVASAQPGCGGAAYQEPCDPIDDPGDYEQREYPTPTDEELWQSSIRRQHDAWAETHLAAEKAVATWWRTGWPTSDFYEELYLEDGDVGRSGTLMEQNPEGTLEDAPYFFGGWYRTIQEDGTQTITTELADGTWTTQLTDGTSTTLGSGRNFVYYDCDPNYDDAESGGCVPADRDYDCAELRSWGIAGIPVIGEDWMLLDDDGDGLGCEPLVTVQQVQTVTPTAEPTKQCDGILGTLGCLLGR